MRDFFKGALKFLGVVAALLGVVVAVLYFFFVRVVEVGHNAMAPTVLVGDRVVVWRGTDFQLGDILLCPHPSEPGRFVMGRFVGRPGQRVRLQEGQLSINGDTPDVDLHPPITFNDVETGRQVQMVWGVETILGHDHTFFYRPRPLPNYREREVEGGLFVLSDNRSYNGEDSRDFGPVHQEECIGSVFMRLTAAESPPEIPHGNLDLIE